MKEAFQQYCRRVGAPITDANAQLVQVEMENSPDALSKFLASSPLDTPTADELYTRLSHLIQDGRFTLADSKTWKLQAEPVGGVPPKGGLLRLTIHF